MNGILYPATAFFCSSTIEMAAFGQEIMQVPHTRQNFWFISAFRPTVIAPAGQT